MAFDSDFDRELTQSLSDLTPEEVAAQPVNPWKNGLDHLTAGVALTSITLNFLNLQYITTSVGIILLVLGFRSLRRENGFFRAGWWISLLWAGWNFICLTWQATILDELIGPFPEVFLYLPVILELPMNFCLWRGILAVKRKAGEAQPSAQPAGALLLWKSVVTALALLHASGWILGLTVIAVYVLIIRSLWKLVDVLDGTGYTVKAAPAGLSDTALGWGYLLSLLACVLLGMLLSTHYPMDWTAVDPGEQSGLEEVRDDLLELGFPEEVLKDLSGEDLAALAGAIRVEFTAKDMPVNQGRRIKQGNFYETVYDVKELRLTDIAVQLSSEADTDRWIIIHHFLWQADPGFRGTESITIWPLWYAMDEYWRPWGPEPAGRVLCDRDGTVYAAPFYSLEQHNTVQVNDWGTDHSTSMIAAYSQPLRGDNVRGYVLYGGEQDENTAFVNSWANYTHQQSWLVYPMTSAKAFDLSGRWDNYAFCSPQSAIQIFD